MKLCEEDQTFVDLFCVIKAGQFDTIVVSDDLKCVHLLKITGAPIQLKNCTTLVVLNEFVLTVDVI